MNKFEQKLTNYLKATAIIIFETPLKMSQICLRNIFYLMDIS